MALASEQLFSGTTTIATDVCNSHGLCQQTSEFSLPQRTANPFLVANDTDTNANPASASASAPNRHLGILEAALDLTLASAPASENNDDHTHQRPPSHTIKIRRSRRSIHIWGCASSHENDNHSRSDADDRRQDEQLYDVATWRMYHRIMESRRRQPATCTLDATAICKVKQEAAATYTKGALTIAPHSQHSDEDESQLLHGGATTPLSKPRSSSILDAAIFDLDL